MFGVEPDRPCKGEGKAKTEMNLVALVLALALTMSVCSALAANTALTINSNITGETGSTYKGYELLKVTAVSGTSYTYEVNSMYADILSANLSGSPTTNIDVYNAIAALTNIGEWSETVLNAIKTAGLEADATITGGSATIEQGYWLMPNGTSGGVRGGGKLPLLDCRRKGPMAMKP